jgi:hypothetical protein
LFAFTNYLSVKELNEDNFSSKTCGLESVT